MAEAAAKQAKEKAKEEAEANIGREGFWEGDEYVCFGPRGKAMRLPYEMRDACGFRAGEIQDFCWSFRLSDILKEKQISTIDARAALKRLGEEPDDNTWLTTINAVDPYARGVFDFQKFLKLAAHFHTPPMTEDELIDAFKVFDRDKSGSIDAIELRDVLLKLGFQITPLEAYDMLAEADDGDGDVSYGEFVNIIMNKR